MSETCLAETSSLVQILAAEKHSELLTEGNVTNEGDQAAEGDGSSTGGAMRQAGVHVVAPCPHDGGCPMDGTESWCHFAQRFRRTVAQKRIKTLEGAKGSSDLCRPAIFTCLRKPQPCLAGLSSAVGMHPSSDCLQGIYSNCCKSLDS